MYRLLQGAKGIVGLIVVLGALSWGEASRAQSREPAAGAMRMYVFDCGTLNKRDGVPYGISLAQMPPRDLSDECMLIVHPRGTLLWETGLNVSVNNLSPTAKPVPGSARPGDRIGKSLQARLAEIGYPPAKIDYLAMSHSHWDHTGNAHDYAGSTWLVQRPERDLMFGATPPQNKDDWAGLEKSKTVILDGDHDVFGDGSVTLIFTPGHTVGHQVLFVKLPKTGPLVLSGDLYHFPEEITLHPTPAGRNAEQIKASMAKVQSLLEKTHGQLWIQHDIQGDAKLKKSPAFYE